MAYKLTISRPNGTIGEPLYLKGSNNLPKCIATVIASAFLTLAAVPAMASDQGKSSREASALEQSTTAVAESRTLATVQQKDELGNGRWLRHELRSYVQATWHWQDLLLVQRSPSHHGGRQLQSVGYLKWAVGFWKQRAARAQHHVQRLLNSRAYLPPAQARVLGHVMAAKLYGWAGQQWRCLDEIWGRLESGWSVRADNPRSPAYGIPQADPGSKMAQFGSNWRNSAWVQIRWGLSYIKSGYHTACNALAVRQAKHSY